MKMQLFAVVVSVLSMFAGAIAGEKEVDHGVFSGESSGEKIPLCSIVPEPPDAFVLRRPVQDRNVVDNEFNISVNIAIWEIGPFGTYYKILKSVPQTKDITKKPTGIIFPKNTFSFWWDFPRWYRDDDVWMLC